MIDLSSDETAVYRVLRPVEWLGARPGDLLYLRPSHPTHPVQLVRKFDGVPMEALPVESLREVRRERQGPGLQLLR